MDGAGVGGPRRDLSDAALLAACSARVDASFANLAARSAILAARVAGSSSSSAFSAVARSDALASLSNLSICGTRGEYSGQSARSLEVAFLKTIRTIRADDAWLSPLDVL